MSSVMSPRCADHSDNKDKPEFCEILCDISVMLDLTHKMFVFPEEMFQCTVTVTFSNF